MRQDRPGPSWGGFDTGRTERLTLTKKKRREKKICEKVIYIVIPYVAGMDAARDFRWVPFSFPGSGMDSFPLIFFCFSVG